PGHQSRPLRVLYPFSASYGSPYASNLPLPHTPGDELAQHREKGWMSTHGFGPYARHPTGRSGVLGLDIEVVEHLDMITEKADGRNDDIAIPLSVHLPDGVVDVRL